MQQSLFVFHKTQVLQSVLALIRIGTDFTDIFRLLAGLAHCIDLVFVEHTCSRMYEGFHIIRRKFGSHLPMVIVLPAFGYVPMDSFERSTFFPQRPKILTAFLTFGICIFIVPILIKPFCKIPFFIVRIKSECILLDVEP